MTEPVWVERDLVVPLHDRLLAEHGGASGNREPGLLDFALARPTAIMMSRAAGDVDELAVVAWLRDNTEACAGQTV